MQTKPIKQNYTNIFRLVCFPTCSLGISFETLVSISFSLPTVTLGLITLPLSVSFDPFPAYFWLSFFEGLHWSPSCVQTEQLRFHCTGWSLMWFKICLARLHQVLGTCTGQKAPCLWLQGILCYCTNMQFPCKRKVAFNSNPFMLKLHWVKSGN